MADTKLTLIVQNLMSEEERKAFLKNFYAKNPRWRGAHVADVLDTLSSMDANVSQTEPLFEQMPDDMKNESPELLGLCMLAILWSQEKVNWSMVRDLLSRRRG